MKSIKFSFIVPHFSPSGDTSLVRRLVNSIPEREDVEILVVDNSINPIKNVFLDRPDVQLLYSDNKYGAGGARNKGIDSASGRWLLFADADDYYLPGFLDIIERNLSDDVDVLFFNVTGDIDSFNPRVKQLEDIYNRYLGTEEEWKIKFKIWTPWNKVISLKYIKDNNFRYELRPVGNDMKFCLEASAATNRTVIIKEQLYFLTNQTGSISFRKKTIDEWLEFLDLLIWQNKFYESHNLCEFKRSLTSPGELLFFLKKYGFKETCHYINGFNKKTSYLKALLKGSISRMIRN